MALERFRFSKDGRKILECCDKFIERCVVPEHVTSIGPYAFGGCEYLKYIKLPDTLAHINQSAFCSCAKLKKIDLPDSLRSVGARTFASSGLKKIRIPAKARLADGVFGDAEQLEEIVFADGAKVVPAWLTYRLHKTPKIVLPDTIEEIGDGAFAGCSDLDEFRIPANLKRIGRFAFRSCRALKELHLPGGIKIDAGAFHGCENLELYLPADAVIKQIECDPREFPVSYSTFACVREIHLVDSRHPLMSKTGKGDLLHRNGMLLWGAGGINGISETSEYGSVGAGAYEGNRRLKVIRRDEFDDDDFGDGDKIIFPHAFENCINLSWADLYDFVTIGSNAFSGCSRLETVDLDDRLKRIGMRAFRYCGSLTSIRIPRQCESIEGEAFYGCSALREVTFSPDDMPRLEYGVFKNCTSLKAISISGRNTAVPIGLCEGCTSLTGVYISPEVEVIRDCAFENCTSLRKIVLPESMKGIGRGAFRNCVNLTDINIPDSVKTIMSGAFANCPVPTFLDLSKVEYIDAGAFADCTSLKYAVVSYAADYRKDSFPEWCKVAKLSI